MVLSIIQMIFPVALKLIGYFVDKKKMDVETKKKWIDFVKTATKDPGQSARIKRSYQAQIEKFEKIQKVDKTIH